MCRKMAYSFLKIILKAYLYIQNIMQLEKLKYHGTMLLDMV